MQRLLPPDPQLMSDAQRAVYDAIASGPRGRVRGPLAVWLHRPELAAHAQALGQYCRYGSSLEQRLSELAILTMGALWKAEFEWWAHYPIALKAGLSADVADAIGAGREPEFEHEDEALVYAFVRTIVDERSIPDALYQRVLEVLGQDRLVDLVGLAGYYTLISMTLKVFNIGLPDGEPLQFDKQK
ncbi:carboxymuconolactone decarboxylase family protein [Pusillimonas sp. MFBS29]|nr:carboxymuconolactone decarboxylase family protein [Pusillimonas sp. MFBS29]MCC2594749.1 carboxymuconolactone decarboxylase family protein [Pusillimonas sp. MFBS29]